VQKLPHTLIFPVFHSNFSTTPTPKSAFSQSELTPRAIQSLADENERLKRQLNNLNSAKEQPSILKKGLRTFSIIEVGMLICMFGLLSMYVFGLIKQNLPAGESIPQRIGIAIHNAIDRYSNENLSSDKEVNVIMHEESEEDMEAYKRFEKLLSMANIQLPEVKDSSKDKPSSTS
jgi:hypothetical protein